MILEEQVIGTNMNSFSEEHYMRTSGLSELEQSILDALHGNPNQIWRFFGLDNGIYYNEQFKPYVRMSAMFNATFREEIKAKPAEDPESPDT
jgi:hypothetical protein